MGELERVTYWVVCHVWREGPYSSREEAEEAAARFDAPGALEVACWPHRVERAPNPLRVGKPDKRPDYAARVVEVLRHDRDDDKENR